MTRPMHPFHRTELLVGGDGYDKLTNSRVCVIGLGGVGSYAAEALVRSGVGHVTLVDFDQVCITNLNRQLHAMRTTVRSSKVQLMVERAKLINRKAEVVGLDMFYEASTSDEIMSGDFDVVLDCIDNMTAKLHLLERCVREDVPVVSAMGAGGRMDPTRVRVTDISKTKNDPFARIVRENLRDVGIESGIRCVWSDELPNDLDKAASDSFRCICPNKSEQDKHGCETRFMIQGTVAWMPGIFGLTMAGVATHVLLGKEVEERAPSHLRMKPTKNKPSRAQKQRMLDEAGFVRQGETSDRP